MSLPSDLIDFVSNQCRGVKGLSDLGIKAIPDQYIQPQEQRLNNPKVVISQECIPVIDVTNWDDPHVAESICNASMKWGFFQIVNHGIPLKVIEDLKSSVHRFFELPAEMKKHIKEKSPVDVVRLGTSFSPHSESVLEWKDYLHLAYDSEEKIQAYWPAICKEQSLQYMKHAKNLIKRLLNVLLNGLNVKKKEMNKEREDALMGSMVLAFNYYPPCTNAEAVSAVGRHSDISSVTVLLQDEVGGLYVRAVASADGGDNWTFVPPVDGALVINIGDSLQIMSNDRYKSIEHQAVANTTKTRISIPIFVSPALDASIGPLPEILEEGEEPKYKRVVFSDYLKHFFSKPHDGKKTIEYAKI